MPTEIERKYLVLRDKWEPPATGTMYRQGYLAVQGHTSVRIRAGRGEAVLTVKSGVSTLERHEYEYTIPLEDAEDMLRDDCAGGAVEKTRYRVPFAGKTWEVDVFHGENAGLVLAEIELDSAVETVNTPPWVGEEVTEDPRYTNAHLAAHPWNTW